MKKKKGKKNDFPIFVFPLFVDLFFPFPVGKAAVASQMFDEVDARVYVKL